MHAYTKQVGGIAHVSGFKSEWHENFDSTPVQVTGMIKWGQESNQNPKNSHADFPSHKNFQSNYTARICRKYHESSDCFEHPKKTLLKSSYSKKYMPKFSYPNKILQSKISNPTKSFDHSCQLKSGVSPPGSWTQALINTSYWPL